MRALGGRMLGEFGFGNTPTPPCVLRKDVKVKELRVRVVQGCDSKGFIRQTKRNRGRAIGREEGMYGELALYTRQYSKLVNGCQDEFRLLSEMGISLPDFSRLRAAAVIRRGSKLRI